MGFLVLYFVPSAPIGLLTGSQNVAPKMTITYKKRVLRRNFKPLNRNLIQLKATSHGLLLDDYKVVWRLKSLPKGKAQHRVLGKRASINLSSGRYLVTMKIGEYVASKTIDVKLSGRTAQVFSFHFTNKDGGKLKKHDQLPVTGGTVRITAYGKNKGPYMKSLSWVIKDSKGKTVKRTRRHVLRMTLEPGVYTAHLQISGKKLVKKFTVSQYGKTRVKFLI